MSKISKRVFGSDLAANIKKKLQNTQTFGAGIFDAQDESATDIVDFSSNTTFGGQGYLSSKSPFARMWTAISVVKKNGEAQDVAVDAVQPFNFDEFRYYFKASQDSADEPQIKKQPITRLPEDGPRIYTLGTNSDNLTARGVLEEQAPAENLEILTPTQRQSYTDVDFQNSNQKKLRPPAGITRVSSTTQGSLGPVAGVLKTTIDFTVYDFEEYDLIYSKYFLRPGAIIFVDFGWTSQKDFSLYDPKDLVKDENRQNYKYVIYGESDDNGINVVPGQIHKSDWDINFVHGKVTNAKADLDASTGAYKCSIDVLSKNSVLFNPSLTEDGVTGNAKENLLADLDYRVLKLAADTLFPDGSIIPDESFTTDDKKTWMSIASSFAAEVLGSPDYNIPSELNTQLGIYWKGTFSGKKKKPTTGPDAIYLSWGFIEDVIFNTEFGEYFKKDEQFIDNSSAIDLDTSNSYTNFSEELYKRQTFLQSGNRILPFLFPENWDKSYSVGKKKTPGRDTTTDKGNNEIPIREIFIQLKIVKQAIKEADSLSEVFTYIFKKLATATGNQWKWEIDNVSTDNSKLGVVDKNYINKRIEKPDEGIESDAIENFYEELFVFKPGSPKTLIKNMSLGLSLGGSDAISSKLALSGLGAGAENVFPASELIDEVVAQMKLEDSEGQDLVEIEYLPREGNSKMESFFDSKTATKPEVADPAYLSSENIYGEGTITNGVPMSEEIEEIINRSSEVQVASQVDKVTPSTYPSDDFEDFRAESGYRYLKNTYDYFTEKYITTSVLKRPTILPITLSLSLHGFGGFAPGDLFRIGMIPSRYFKYVFFQVMTVSQNVTPGNYTTDIKCVMRFRDDKKENVVTPEATLKTKKVISPFALKTEFNCKGIDKVLPLLGYIEPVYDNKTNVEYIFKVFTRAGGTTDKIYDCIDKTFAYEKSEDKTIADDFYSNLKNATPSFCKVQKKQSDDKAKLGIYKTYDLAAEKEYFIYIKKQTWFLNDSLTTGDIEAFTLLEPKPDASLDT